MGDMEEMWVTRHGLVGTGWVCGFQEMEAGHGNMGPQDIPLEVTGDR